ncbi:calcium-binding protein, partial [Sinorhizobium meliloti]
YESAKSGADTVYASASYSLATGQEVEALRAISSTATTAINLTGNEFANTVVGNAGANKLNGGSGMDVLTGGAGLDTFIFNTTLGTSNVDRITDFSVMDDTIWIDDVIFFKAGKPGDLASSAFRLGTAAGDSTDRIIYDGNSGALLYDTDGKGGAAAVQFAYLSKGLSLTHHDFDII